MPVSRDPNRANSGQRDGWAAGTPFETMRECSGERLVAHSGDSLPKALKQAHLLSGEVMPVTSEGAFEILSCLPQKVRISCDLPR